MGTPLIGPAAPRQTTPHFSMGRLTGGLTACLWLWASAGALAAAPGSNPSPATSASAYQQALERFNHNDDSRALHLLEQIPASKDAHEQADILNLKGAIYLRQHRSAEARTAFDDAARRDPGLWAARFNAAEVSFRDKNYGESRRQFDTLLGQTGRLSRPDERHLVEYKLKLADLLDGNEKPAADFVDAHRHDRKPPLEWYYLNAAMEHQHGHAARGDELLQKVGEGSQSPSGQVFADSFAELGWSARNGADHPASHDTPVKRSPDDGSPAVLAASAPAPARPARTSAPRTRPTTLALVELIPGKDSAPSAQIPLRDDANTDGPRPAFRFGNLPPSSQPVAAQMPPTHAGMNPPPIDETSEPVRVASSASPVADVLARRKSHATPAPSAAPTGSPGENENSAPSPLPSPDASVSPAPKSDATPAGTPSPAFIQKYEAAMVLFLQKDYAGAKKLLDEADAIQPGQPNATVLRNQIFKQYYEAAYTAYQHTDYTTAITQLDGADSVGSNAQNQSDAYNLRGLVLSKQRNYPEAETMFHKAVQADPGLWAAKFNYAEVPFNYRNFTVARARFEELFGQTDPVKQPVEAELTQFKVFLTLLLEGKEDAARTFMQHFNFSGITPARYFCQAALNFYGGDVDKAQGWIDSARKEYPARKSSSFMEAFYRVGWLVDPNAPVGGASAPMLAAASPAAAPVATPAAGTPAPALAAVTPPARPASTPALAQNVPLPTGQPAVPKPAASTSAPMIAAASVPPVPAFRAMVTPPASAPSVPPIIAAATPAASSVPRATASVPVKTTPAASVPMPVKVAVATPKPAPSAPVARTPLPTPAPVTVPAVAAQPASTGGDFLRAVVIGFVLLYFLYVVSRILLSALNRKPRRTAGGTPSRGLREGTESDPLEARR